MSSIVSLLQSGLIMDMRFEVYESHIPFLMQFMMDHNVCGMDEIKVSNDECKYKMVTLVEIF